MIGVGMPFETSIISFVQKSNSDVLVVNTSASVSLLQEEHGDHGHIDPHIWLSPVMAQNIASAIADGLAKSDPAHADQYLIRANYLIQELLEVDAEFRTVLTQKKVDTFLISHPSWGYTAREYGLLQVAINEDGKEPSPKTLKNLIDIAASKNLSVIIADPLENQNTAHVIAKEISAELVVVNPLAYDYIDNLRRFLFAIT
jgi:zinc transport system substrate-binding protein